jgi:hypothetical protein
MKTLTLTYLLILGFAFSGNSQFMCSTNIPKPERVTGVAKSINDIKYVRINIHFRLRSDGSGNFTETSDGDGRGYTGYQYAIDHVRWMNYYQGWNELANIPKNHSIPQLSKNYYYILNSVHFERGDNTYYYSGCPSSSDPNYTLPGGVNVSNVMNLFFNHSTDADIPTAILLSAGNTGGCANNISASGKSKFTELRDYWTHYRFLQLNGLPMDWHWHACPLTSVHETSHLMTLSHTVMYNWAAPCPVDCGQNIGQLDPNCDDGCSDTPTALEIVHDPNNINCVHPAQSWSPRLPNAYWATSNVMDYCGGNTLTPCQLNLVHTALEGGMRTYLSCEAVKQDMSYCDIGYPYISYFGKKVNIGGCSNQLADVTNREVLAAYFSESLDLQNFEVRADSEFDVIYQPVCPF